MVITCILLLTFFLEICGYAILDYDTPYLARLYFRKVHQFTAIRAMYASDLPRENANQNNNIKSAEPAFIALL